MDKLTLEYIKQRASESETGSIKAVSCEDVRALLEEREELLTALRTIANKWTHETPTLPADHARKIAQITIGKAEKES